MALSNEFVTLDDFEPFNCDSLPAHNMKARFPSSRWELKVSELTGTFSTIGRTRSSKSNSVGRLVVLTHSGYKWEVLPRAFSGERALDHAAQYARTLEHQRYWSEQFHVISRTIKEDRWPDLKIVFLKVFSRGSRAGHPSGYRFPYTSLYAISSGYRDPFNLVGAKFCGTDETTVRSGINGDIFIVIEMEILEALYSPKGLN
jgi:hypothetical protein